MCRSQEFDEGSDDDRAVGVRCNVLPKLEDERDESLLLTRETNSGEKKVGVLHNSL